jgi:hypothetical protein
MGPDMKRTLLDWFLLLVVLVGSFLAWQTGRERSRLTERHSRLARLAGDLPIIDPTKLHALALQTGDPLHFAWRIYVPPNYSPQLRGSGMAIALGSARASEFIARVRVRPDDKGDMQVYTHFGNTTSGTSLGMQAIVSVLENRWDKLKVEQLGAHALTVIKADQPAVLLRLTLPDDLHSEVRKKVSLNGQKQSLPVLFELNLGP